MTETIDITVFAAFGIGLLSFISPCVLPLVPGYLSAITGLSFSQNQRPRGIQALTKILLPATIFCLAFSCVFVALGVTATGLGTVLRDNRSTLDRIAGGVIIGLGCFFILTPFVPGLSKQWHPQRLLAKAATGGPLIAGAAFAFAWTPCIGPTLSAILSAAAIQETAAKGALLLGAYSAGLAIPFLLSAVAFSRAWGAFRWLRDRFLIVIAISGTVLIGMGLLMVTGELTQLNIEAQRLLTSLDLNFFKEL